MTIGELAKAIEGTIVTGGDGLDREIKCGYCCDLLSWVMAHGREGMAWVTVQAHMNVVAVAVLADMACVVAAEGVAFPQDVIDKAREEGLHLMVTPMSAYAVAGIMAAAGVA